MLQANEFVSNLRQSVAKTTLAVTMEFALI